MNKLTSRIRPRTRTNLAHKWYRLKRRYGYYDIGAVIQPQPNVADMLLKRDIIEPTDEPVEPPAKPVKATAKPIETAVEPKQVKRPRGRPRKNPEA